MFDSNKVYIYGSEGYIGAAILNRLVDLSFSSYTVGRREHNDVILDLAEIDINAMPVFNSGDCFIFLAAISSPEQCATNFDYAYRVNVTNSALVIENLLEQGVNVLFASSDTVYGRTDTPVDELDNVNPQFAYAEMKAEIEDRFKNNDKFKVMRLSYVWSLNDKFTSFILESQSKNEMVEIYDPFIRSIISLEDVLAFIIKFIEYSNNIPGVVNLAGPHFVTRHQLVEYISKYVPVDFHVSRPDDDFFRYRPDQILMKSLYLHKVLGRNATNLEDEIKRSFLTN